MVVESVLLSSRGVDWGVVVCNDVEGGVVGCCVWFGEYWWCVAACGGVGGDVVGVVAIGCCLGGGGGGLVGGAMCVGWTMGDVGCVEIWVHCFLLPLGFLV